MPTARLCQLLGIQYPIIQGAVPVENWVELAAAVSEAGGLGTTFSLVPPRKLREGIQRIKTLTGKPFAVNAPLFFGEKRARQVIDVAIEERVKVVTTSAGNPELFTKELKQAGIVVMHVVGCARHAAKAAAAGVDAIIASGVKAGGWQSYDEVTTLVLIPQVVDAVKGVPVVAAGGIADARGFVAALALGAQGIQMGTRFIACVEAGSGQDWNDRILKATDTSTEIVGRGKTPLRAFKPSYLREAALGTEVRTPIDEELDVMLSPEEPTPRGQAGQISGMISDVLTAKEIIDQILAGVRLLQGKLNKELATVVRGAS